MLLRGAIAQHLLQVVDRVDIDHGNFAIAQSGMILPGKEQALDVRRCEAFTVGCCKRDVHIEPLLAGRSDPELRFDSLDFLRRAALKSFFESDAPLALHAWEFASEKVED